MLLASLLMIIGGCAIGCTKQPDNNSIQPSDTDLETNPYEAFVQKIESENLDKYSIDIVSMLNEHLSQYTSSSGYLYLDADDITNIDYTLSKCNLSKSSESALDDMIIKIDIIKNVTFSAGSAEMYVLFAFVLNEDGQFDTVLDEEVTGRASGFNYELMDVTGNSRDEIILQKSVRYHESLSILAWNPKQSSMSIIFDEDLFHFMLSYTYKNSYHFVPTFSGSYDIRLDSKIYRTENDIIEEGSTRFVYNGDEYIVGGAYYDYRARSEAIGKMLRANNEE